ncbi:hypothetical protein ACLB1G_11510 [Oxalobacteraceae bacterium A2-2]
MTVALNSVTNATTIQSYVPTVSSSAAASSAAQASTAASLSANSAVVATLGGSTGAQVYTPAGLLDSIQQAGTVAQPETVPEAGSDTQLIAQQDLDAGLVGNLATGGTPLSGIYSGVGTAGLSSDAASANWAEVLKSNPELAGSAIEASFNSGVLSTIRVTA